MHFLTLLLLSALISVVSGHGRIKIPKPLDAPPEDPSGNAYNAPLSPSGSDFPCKGLHKKAGVDKTPTQTWQAGSMAAFEILGHVVPSGEGALAAHSGGSCQASLSFDDGVTWKAVHSFEGGCPRGCTLGSNMAGPNQTFPFMVPPGTKSGNCLFAWTWTAVSGNRDEFYMDCASVKISGSGTSTLDEYPDMFVGDMNIPGQIATGECRSTAGNALLYPNPGPSSQVTQSTVDNIPFKKPSDGQCFAPGSKSSGTGSSVASPSLGPTAVVAPSSVTSSYPVVQPSSYGAVSTSLSMFPTSHEVMNPVDTSSYPVVQPSSYGAVSTSLSMFPTSHGVMNPVDTSSYPVVQPSSYGAVSTSLSMFPTSHGVMNPVDTSSYPVVQPSSYGAVSTSLSMFPTSHGVMNPTSYPVVQPNSDGTGSTGYLSPTSQSSSYSFARSYTGGASHSRSHTREGHGSGYASSYPTQASNSYPISYTMTTLLTYTTSAVTPAVYSPTPETSAYYAQKVSSPAYQTPSTPTYRYV